MTRAGQVVFDAEVVMAREEDAELPPPPPYAEAERGAEEEKKLAFVLEDGASDDDVPEGSQSIRGIKARRQGGPSLLTRQASSKSSAGAEIDMSPQTADISNNNDTASISESSSSLTSFRKRVDPHDSSDNAAESTSARPGDGQTRQYWLRKNDTLQSIAIRFNVSTNELCLLNSLPRAVLSTSPHLLHTRSFILIPAHAVEKQLSTNPDLLSSLEGPPQRSARDKTAAARRTAEAKFRAQLSRNAASSSRSNETPADEKAARAYIGLAEDEFRLVDFGEGTDELGLPLSYEEDVKEGKSADAEMVEAQRDTARTARFDAILSHALAKWEMDSDWERCQRANGVDPSTISELLPASASSSSSSAGISEKEKRSSKIGSWFSRALNAEPPTQTRGEHSVSLSRSSPRHVVSLSSSPKLPTRLVQTFAAHKGPVNVARYNSLGRYLLTGGTDRYIRLWNAKSGSEDAIKTYTEHAHEVLALDISTDNSRFASGGADKSVFVWDVAMGSVLRRFNGWAGKVNDLRFGGKDADGSVVVVAGWDGTVRVFDLRAQGAWRPIMQMDEAKDAVTSLVVRDDSIYSGSVDGVLRCYDLRSGQLRSDTFPAPITSVTPSRLGTSVLVSTLDSTLRLLDNRDGTLLQSYNGHKHQSYRCKATLTNEEDAVISGDEEGNLVGWDMVSSERLSVGPKEGSAHGKPILWVEANPDQTSDGPEIVTASADGTVKIWSTP